MHHYFGPGKSPFNDPLQARKKMVELVRQADLAGTREEHDRLMDFAISGMSSLELMEFLREWDHDVSNGRRKIEKLERSVRNARFLD
jgi:hypothetical protein